MKKKIKETTEECIARRSCKATAQRTKQVVRQVRNKCTFDRRNTVEICTERLVSLKLGHSAEPYTWADNDAISFHIYAS